MTASGYVSATPGPISVQQAGYGARGDGVTDDTTAIQRAISNAPPGGEVYFPAGNYLISRPLTIGAVTLRGVTAGFYGTDTTHATTISIASNFVGTAAVASDDTASGILTVRELLIYGGRQTSGSVIGFRAAGSSGPAVNLIRVSVNHFQGNNIQIGDATHTRTGVRCEDVQAYFSDGASSDAWYINTSDSEFTRCMGFQGTNGFHVVGCNNTVFTGCRAEHNKVAGRGWYFDACQVTGGIVLDACTTDQNDGDGFLFSNLTNASLLGGSGVVQLSGCVARRDGNNGGTGGGSFAGFNIAGCAVPVILDGCAATVERGDTSGWGPARGLRVQGSFYVLVNGGAYTATANAIVDSGSNTTFRRGPNVLTGVNTSGTTTWTTNDPWGTDNSSTFTQTGNSNSATLLSQTNSGTNVGAALIEQNTAAAASESFGSRVSGDANRRFVLKSDGTHEWGPGSGARDVNLYRSVAATIKTDNNLTVAGILSAAGVTDWLNVKTYGALGNGVADDTTAIQNALNAAYTDSATVPVGKIVYMPQGTYRTSVPLVVPPYVTLIGPYAARGSVTQAATIRPLSTFTGTAVISMVDAATGGYSTPNEGVRLLNLTIDGAALGSTTASGVSATGYVHGVVLINVSVNNVTDRGIQTTSNGSGSPYSWHLQNVQVGAAGVDGFRLAGATDSTLIGCRTIGAGRHGYYIDGMANSTFTACRSEWSGSKGWNITASWGTGTGAGGATFNACTTDRNNEDGFYINSTGPAQLVFKGCIARRDGKNGGTGGGSFAGFKVDGATTPVIGVASVFPGVSDDGTGTNSPQYGVSVVNSSTAVIATEAYLHANTAGWNDDGTNGLVVKGPGVVSATGTVGSPTRETTANLHLPGNTVGVATPFNHNLVAWTTDPAVVTTGQLAANGTVYLVGVYVARAASVTKIYWGINTAGVTATASQNEVGLYNSTGTKLASANVDTQVTSTGMFVTTISSTAVTPGLYWVGMVFNASTAPSPYRGGFINATLVNAGLAAAKYRYATNGTGATALPSSITPGSNAASQSTYWAAIA